MQPFTRLLPALPQLAGLVLTGFFASPAIAALNVYVDAAADFSPANPANGTSVTWKPGSPDAVSGLTFGTNAFSTVQAAINAVDANGSVLIADGTYKQGATLTINKNLTLQGDGSSSTLLSGNSNGNNSPNAGEYRVLDVTGGSSTVMIRDLSIVDGQGQVTGGTAGNSGAGILNSGILTLEDIVVARNVAASGGGIENTGTLTLERCVVSENRGGGITNSGTMTLNQSTVSSNFTFNNGGGISNGSGGETILNHSIVTSNTSNGDGAGISNTFGGSLTLNHSEVRSNASSASGGGIRNWGGTTTLHSSTVAFNRSNGGEGGAGISNLGTLNNVASLLVLNDSTISQNTATPPSGGFSSGGGILNRGTVQMNRSALNLNQAGYGAGFYNLGSSAVLTANGCTWQGNNANNGSGFGSGGGLYNENRATIRNSTFSQNRADYDGGGIFNYSHIDSSMVIGAVLTLESCTISGNQARSGAGAFNFDSVSEMNLVHCTVTANTGVFSPGLNNDRRNSTNDGTLNLTNSIVAGNTKTTTVNSTDPNLSGPVNEFGNNIIGIPSGLTIQSLIGPLADNGGTTFTHAPPAGSPLIDAADDAAIPPGVTTDQRGAFRSIGAAADIGSFEVGSAPSLVSVSPPNGTGGFSQNDTITLTANVGMLPNPLGSGASVELRLRSDDSVLPSTTAISGANIIVTVGNISGVAPLSEFYLRYSDSAFISAETGVPLPGFSGGSYFTLADAVYVDDLAADFTITNDQGTAGLDTGDTVSWKPGTADEVTGLIFGAEAFLGIQDAVDAVVSDGSGIVRIAAGLYREGGTVTVNKSVRLIGDDPLSTEVNGNADSDTTSETGEYRVFLISGSSRVVGFESLAINNGQPSGSGSGGGIFVNGANDLTLRNVSFANNRGNRGAAISNSFSSDIHIIDCSFTGNQTADAGGAIFNSNGSLIVERSTFNNNRSNKNGGGAFYMNTGTLHLVNSTLSQNNASGNGSQGGAIYNDASSQIEVFNSTIVDNQTSGGGGFWLGNNSTLTLTNSVVAGNRGTSSNADIRVGNPVVAGGVNFIGDLNGTGLTAGTQVLTFTSGQTLADLVETGIADNGGPTRTHQLVPGSPLIDAAVDSAVPIGTSTDQRGSGYPRFQNSRVDIGAVEYITPPRITMASPASGSRDFDGDHALVFIFDQIILQGSGSIGLFLASDNSPVPATVAINATALTITPDAPLPFGTAYYLTIEPRTLSNLDGTAFFNEFQRLDFTTAVAATYVDAAGDFTPANPAMGQAVTWNGAAGSVSGLTFGTNAFTSIQDAVDSVIAGGTVNIAAGNYAEGSRIDITKNITIQGDGAAATILSGQDLYTVLDVSGSTTEAIINGLTVTRGLSEGVNSGGAGIRSQADLTLNDCAIRGNVSRNGGGGIYNALQSATLTLNRCTLSGNTASNDPINAAGIGGAILNIGTLVLNNSTLSGNYARNDGGAINSQGSASVVEINHSTIVGNDSDDIVGGVYFTGGSVTLNNSIVAGNTASAGGDLSAGLAITFQGVNFIGNITSLNGFRPGTDLTFSPGQTLGDLINTTLANNGGTTLTHALVGGSPALDAGDNSTIPAGLTTDQRGVTRIIEETVDIGAFEAGSSSLYVHQLAGDFTITNDQANSGLDAGDTVTWNGTSLGAPVPDLIFGTDAFLSVAEAITAARENATIHIAGGTYLEGAQLAIGKDLTLQGDGADVTVLSGADTHRVFSVSGATTTAVINDVSITRGFTSGQNNGGAGISNTAVLTLNGCSLYENAVRNNASGGAISNIGASADLTINRSTISGNSAGHPQAVEPGIGGGIANTGTLTLNNSTLSGNYARSDGGAIQTNSASVLVVNHSTIVANNTNGSVGGIYTTSNSVLITNSIVAGNTSSPNNDLQADSSLGITFQGVNFIGKTTDILTFRPETDLTFADGQTLADLLVPTLTNNGGPTRTHALVPGSPVLNAGNNALIPSGVTTDQRGYPRVLDGTVDIGAVEFTPAFVLPDTELAMDPGLSGKIRIADLLSAISGGGGLPLTFVSHSQPGQPGSVVRISGDFLVYQSAPGQTLADSFTYTVTDGIQTLTGTITVEPDGTGDALTFNITSLEVAQGVATIRVAGIPGTAYQVESSETMAPASWSAVGDSQICPTAGIMTFTDPAPLPPGRFYRAVRVLPNK